MTDTPHRVKFVNSLVAGIWGRLQNLNIHTLEVSDSTEAEVLEQVQPNINHIQNAARYKHGYTE